MGSIARNGTVSVFGMSVPFSSVDTYLKSTLMTDRFSFSKPTALMKSTVVIAACDCALITADNGPGSCNSDTRGKVSAALTAAAAAHTATHVPPIMLAKSMLEISLGRTCRASASNGRDGVTRTARAQRDTHSGAQRGGQRGVAHTPGRPRGGGRWRRGQRRRRSCASSCWLLRAGREDLVVALSAGRRLCI
jgi:hypothetical protein